MAELHDFSTGEPLSLTDFAPDRTNITISNKASNLNYAANSAVLGHPGELESTYRAIAGELEIEGKSNTASMIVDNVRQRQFNSERQALIEFLNNPGVPLAQKEKAALGFTEVNLKPSSLMNAVSEEALIAPSAGETVEAEEVRINLAESLTKINEHKKAIQSIANREMSKVDPDVGNKAVSFLELLAPFSEQSQLAGIVKEWNESGEKGPSAKKAVVLMGEAKADIVKAMSKMPPEQLRLAAEKMADILNTHKGIVLTDDNAFTHMGNIQAFINGDYSVGDRIIDDITSLLDLTIIGGPVAKGIGKAVKGAQTTAKVTKGVAATGDAVDNVLGSLKAQNAAKEARAAEDAATAAKRAEEAKQLSKDVIQWLKDGRPSDSPIANMPIKMIEDVTYELPEDLAKANPEQLVGKLEAWLKAGRPESDISNMPISALEGIEPGVTLQKVVGVTDQGFEPVARARADYSDGFTIEQANQYAELINKQKGWKEARAYLEEFKGLLLNPAGNVAHLEMKARRNLVRSEVSPVTVSQNYKDVNPEKARAVHELVAGDLTEEAAQAAYGTSRTEAIANDLLPEVGNGIGGVRNKVGSIDSQLVSAITPNARVMDFVTDPGMNYYFKEEKVAQRARVVNDFKSAVGLKARDEMFNVEALDSGVRINAIYGPKEGGFSSYDDAVELAKYSLREYGIEDNQIQILKRVGEDYVPVARSEEGLKGDYLISVNHDYRFNPADMQHFEKADVKRNGLDWFAPLTEGRAGSLQRHFMDAHSMLHPVITRGANAVVDKGVGLERALALVGEDFGKGYAKLPKDRKALVNKFIVEANEKGIDFNYNTMMARGLNSEEVNVLKKWREAWDTIYWLENADLAKTLHNRGYKVFIDKANDTEVIARPIARNQTGDSVRFYDATTDSIKTLNREELSKLYEEGGTVAKLRTPISAGDDVAEFVVSAEKPGHYLRGINPNDQVLTYRKGYYTVFYKDPQFVIQKVKNKDGKVLYEKAVASAGSTRDAEFLRKRMIANGGSAEDFYVRGDIKKLGRESDEYWDTQTSIGRTAQKVRGKRLEDATSTITDPKHNNVLDPMESLIKSIRSTSNRVSMRDYLEATKARFMRQFDDVIKPNPNGWGEKTFPASRKELGKPGVAANKELMDARTTYEYIQYLEKGYINAIDDGYKAGLNGVAELLGKYESKWTSLGEKLAREAANAKGPTAAMRNLSFTMYLALNPLRQLVVQGHQVARLTALFPGYMASGKMFSDLSVLSIALRTDGKVPAHMVKLSGMTEAEIAQMVKDYKRSGLQMAVDANNLVRDDLKNLADVTLGQKAMHIMGTPIRLSQKVGFDAGEKFNIMTSWLAHRHQAIEQGLKLTPETMDNVAANARNFTYNMNVAGDMPYNRNALNVMFQYMQVPHKALLQDFTNRIISPKDRAKLLAFDTMMWGTGSVAAIPVVNGMLNEIQDPEVRRLITNGLEEYSFNKLISLATGKETSIDFSDLAPGNMAGIWETASQIWTTDIGEILASSPSGQLFFGNSPRLTNAFTTAARYFHLVDDYSDPTEFKYVAHEFAKLASGYSNMFKASYALKYGEKINTNGVELGAEANEAEAVAQLFGFRTLKEAQMAKVSQEVYEKSKDFEKDINKHIDEMIRHFRFENKNQNEIDYSIKVLNEGWRVFGNNPRVQQIVQKRLEKDANRGELSLYKSLEASMGLIPKETWINAVNSSGLSQEKVGQLLEVRELFEQYKGNN